MIVLLESGKFRRELTQGGIVERAALIQDEAQPDIKAVRQGESDAAGAEETDGPPELVNLGGPDAAED
jgi:hypothetical protein